MRRLVLAALVFAAGGAWFAAPAQAAGGLVHAASTTFNDGAGCATSPGETTTIAINESVTWHNCDSYAHTITSDSGDAVSFDQPLPPGPNGGDVTITFHSAGSFPYHCTIHGAGMKGTIVVTQPPATTTTTEAPATTQPPAATTTAKPTTTTSSTVRTTTTTEDISGVFSQDTTPTDPTTTLFTTETTRALGGGGSGTSAGLVAALVVGLGAVGTVVALIIRRMRAGTPPS